MYHMLTAKTATLWGWLAIPGKGAYEFTGEVTIRDGTFALDLTIEPGDFSSLRSKELPKLTEAISALDFPISEPDQISKALLGLDFKKEILNKLVYLKLADELPVVY